MFDVLRLPPGHTLRLDLDPAEAPLSLTITLRFGDRERARIRIAPASVPNVEALQELIDMGRAPDTELMEELRRTGQMDDAGQLTAEAMEGSQRVITCVDGPHAGLMVAIPGRDEAWTTTGYRIGNDEPVEPPPGGIYRVDPNGLRMRWIPDGTPSATILPFRGRRKPQ